VPGLADFHRGRTLFLPTCPLDGVTSRWPTAYRPPWAARSSCSTTREWRPSENSGLAKAVRRRPWSSSPWYRDRWRRGNRPQATARPLGAAGEIGHQTILPDGPLCGCGNRGCLETLAGGPALIGAGVRLMKSGHAPLLYDMVQGSADRVTPRLMAQAAAAGDSSVREELLRAARMLGIGVANVIAVLYRIWSSWAATSPLTLGRCYSTRETGSSRARPAVPGGQGTHREFGAPGESRSVGRCCAGHRPRQTGGRPTCRGCDIASLWKNFANLLEPPSGLEPETC